MSMKKIAVTFGSYLANNYVKYVVANGGYAIPVTHGMRTQDIVDLCDGLLLTGGRDIHPVTYGKSVTRALDCDINRDRMEMSLSTQFYRVGKPIFGICRGFQLLLNNTIIPEIRDCGIYTSFIQEISYETTHIHAQGQNSIKDGDVCHSIETFGVLPRYIESGSFVNSYHHQGFVGDSYFIEGNQLRLEDRFDFIKGTAFSECCVLEGILIQSENNTIAGVQWHPEKMHSKSDELFRAVMGL